MHEARHRPCSARTHDGRRRRHLRSAADTILGQRLSLPGPSSPRTGSARQLLSLVIGVRVGHQGARPSCVNSAKEPMDSNMRVETNQAVGRPGFLVLRAFFAEFWLLQFYGKAHDAKTGTVSLENVAHWSTNLTADFVRTTPLAAWMVRPYTLCVPIAEIAIGLLLLIGLKTRATLIGASAFLVSLDMGLLFQSEYEIVKYNTILLLALLWALVWEPMNAFSADAWLAARHRTPSSGPGVRIHEPLPQ
jgi:thiosulfate dehydrogenase (quinone) large subunit